MTNMAGNKQFIALACKVLDIEAAAILAARARLGSEFLSAAELLLSRSVVGRVVVMGMGKSGHIGCKIAATLASTGTPALFVHPGEAGHGDLGMITKTDTVLAISQSGESDEILRLIPYFKFHNIPLITMTGLAKSQLALSADVVILTEVEREACPLGLAPTASTTLALALGDALAITLLEARGFTSDDFALTHPLGALGRRLLTKVADIMTPLSDVPLVQAKDKISEVILTITKQAAGFAIVATADGRPQGIFTDGDLRRALGNGADIQITPIERVMTNQFSSIEGSKLAVEALKLMESRFVSALPVIDIYGNLEGTITMKQILAAGVI